VLPRPRFETLAFGTGAGDGELAMDACDRVDHGVDPLLGDQAADGQLLRVRPRRARGCRHAIDAGSVDHLLQGRPVAPALREQP
jgi:hypothetical protein